MNTSYHNTTTEPMQLTIYYETKAKDQEDGCLYYFGMYNTLSPSQLYNCLINGGRIHKETPLTSIRRAITNLTTRGLLRKTDTKVMGKYGRMESLWEKV